MRKAKVRRNILLKRWLHSHEEDSSSLRVYRPESFHFPLSRGRSGFEFRRDGSYVEIGIAPTDRPEETEGRWVVEGGDTLILARKISQGAERRLRVVSVDPEKLVVKQ